MTSAAAQVPTLPATTGPSTATVPVLPAASTVTASTPPNADGSCPAGAPVNVSRAGIYHLLHGDGSYSRTHSQRCYATSEAAQAAGFRAPR